MSNKVVLTADLIEAFAGTFLSGRYDDAKPTPPFHREVWELYASDCKQAGAVAPRDHAKSTGFTFDYILAEVCFRTSDYVILIGSTEDKAAEQLSNISEELESNEDLRREFGIVRFESQQKTDIILECDDSHRFRILARGAEQKIRGAMWKGKRPNLIVCDDMEDDEQVESKDRREKFRRWFFRAAKQALSRSGKIRVHGTILHDDSLLSRLIKNKIWSFKFFKAHKSYSDFSELLWSDRWTAEDLRNRQIEFEEDGDSAGYSQEFLNTPLDNNEPFFRKQDFRSMSEEDHATPKLYGVGVDLAISKKDKSNKTVFVIGGRDVNNLIHVVDVRRGRMDSMEIVEEFFSVWNAFHPEMFWVENGQIWLGISTFLENEMQIRGQHLPITVMQPIGDKGVRARSHQKRNKSGLMRYDKGSDWYAAYEAELLKFTDGGQALEDDQVDGSAWMSRGFDMLGADVNVDDFVEDEYWDAEAESRKHRGGTDGGRSVSTGY